MKKRKLTTVIIVLLVLAVAALFVFPAEYKLVNTEWLSNSELIQNGRYDRQRACEQAKYAYEHTENGVFRYLDPGHGDRATNCANFVSQCLYAGGWEMNDEWFMKQYNDSVIFPKRFADKLCSFAKGRIYDSTGFIKEKDLVSSDMEYKWSNTWTCAGVQLEYGESRFYSGCYEVMNFSELESTVADNNIKPGDVIYENPGNIIHVLMITDIDSNGRVYYSSHNPPTYNRLLDEDAWRKGGFTGGILILHVKDELM